LEIELNFSEEDKLKVLYLWSVCRLHPRFIDLPVWGEAVSKGGGDVRYVVPERLKG
jgi:hypothetical protein